MTDHEKQVIDRLREYEKRFSEILDLIGDKLQLWGEDRTRPQQLLKDLKASLEKDCKDLRKRKAELNRYERDFLEPALRETEAEITVTTNSIPGGKWFANLSGARASIAYRLNQLEE